MSKLTFTCPSCKTHGIDEVLSGDVAVITWINSIDEDGNVEHGIASNEGGYVVRYQCRECGYIIVDDVTCGDDPLDEGALVKAIVKLNISEDRGDSVSHEELVLRFSDALSESSGKELARMWNEISPDEVIYDGNDEFYWVKGVKGKDAPTGDGNSQR